MSNTDVWAFETDRDERHLRLDAVRQAWQMHDSGFNQDGDTVLDTAAKIMNFINES